MRRRGAGAIAVVVLVVVILACIGFIVWRSKSGPPPVAETHEHESRVDTYVCKAPGCGFQIDMFLSDVAKQKRGPAFDGGGKEMMKCPKCGKFSLVKRMHEEK